MIHCRLFIALLFASVNAKAQTNAGDFSALGAWVVPRPGLIRYAVPASAFRSLPGQIGLYSRAAQTPLPKAAVEWVIDRCLTNAAEAASAKARVANEPALLNTGVTALKASETGTLRVAPESGTIQFYRVSFAGPIPKDLINNTASSGVLGTNVLLANLQELVAKLKLDTNQIDFDPTRSELHVFRNRTRHPPPTRQPVIVERSVVIKRCLDKCPLIPDVSSVPVSFHEIVLTRELSGDWREIKVHWPRIERDGSMRMPCKSQDELSKLIEGKKLLWDHGNSALLADAKQIVITEIRIGYFEPKASAKIVPLLLLDAEMDSASESKQYVVLILPMLEGNPAK